MGPCSRNPWGQFDVSLLLVHLNVGIDILCACTSYPISAGGH